MPLAFSLRNRRNVGSNPLNVERSAPVPCIFTSPQPFVFHAPLIRWIRQALSTTLRNNFSERRALYLIAVTLGAFRSSSGEAQRVFVRTTATTVEPGSTRPLWPRSTPLVLTTHISCLVATPPRTDCVTERKTRRRRSARRRNLTPHSSLIAHALCNSPRPRNPRRTRP